MALVGAMVFSQSVWAQDYDGSVTLDDGITIYYHFHGDHITICAPANVTWDGFNMPVGDLVIPASITHQGVSYPVTDIEPEAFKNCIYITSVIIPNSVNNIAYNAFFRCYGITSLTIGSSVINISDGAFADCFALEEIHFRSANPPTLNGIAFLNHNDVPVYVPCGSLLNYSGWGGFTDIRGESEKVKIGSLWYLLDCANLTATVVPELSVPQQITSRLYSSQESCPSGNISIPASVGYGNQNFNVTAIGDGAFAYCQNISSIVIPESVTSIGNSAFAHCLDIASVVIPEGVTTIGNSAFYYCIELESVTMPNSMTGIGNEAFRNCDNLESLTIGNSVTSIGNEAFRNCGALESLTIGNSVTSIGNGAFRNCGTLESVTIPNSVISIGDRAFYGCVNLQTLTIGNSVTTIGAEAFMYCDNLTTLSIPNSVTSIGNRAFSDCINLTTLTFGNSVTTIGIESFSGCISLTSLTIPNSVTSIGDRAFLLFDQLTEIHSLASTPSSLGNEVFYNTDETIPVYVPCGTVSAYRNAFGWNNFTNIQEEPTCTHTVSVDVNDQSMGSVSGGGTYTVGTTASLTATPECFHRFVRWTNATGDEVSTENPLSVSVVSDTTLTAVFEEADRVLIGKIWYRLDQQYSTATIVAEKDGNDNYEDGHRPTGELDIPSMVTYCNVEYTVTAIADKAFYNCRDLMGNLVIPNSVTEIGEYAFDHCIGFTGTLTLPNTIGIIKRNSFSYCNFTGSLVIPASVTNIQSNALEHCSGFTGDLVIPNSVKSITIRAFYGCSGFTSLTIGSAVQIIREEAFRDCTGLTSIEVKRSTPPTLQGNPFRDCSMDIPVTVPCGTVSAYQAANGWSSFNYIQEVAGCLAVTVASSNDNWGTVTGGGSYAPGATATLTATPNCGYRFVRWKNTNDETVSTDAECTFTVTQDTTITAVFSNRMPIATGGQTLWYTLDCDHHTATVIPEKEVSLQIIACPYTTAPTGDIVIPASVEYDNQALDVTAIGDGAFGLCTGITSVVIPESVTSIGRAAFGGCSAMTSVTIPEGVASIGMGAFATCTALTSLTLPATLSSIGMMAFSGCTGLTEIHSLRSQPVAGTNLFYSSMLGNNNIDPATPVYVPCGTVDAYNAANGWKYFTHIQEEPTCTHTVSVDVNDPSMGTVSGDGTYTVGATATLTATPNCGYRFVQWTSNSTPVSTDNPVSFIVTKDTALTAEFEALSSTTGIEQVCSTGQTLVYNLNCPEGTATLTGYTGTCTGDLVIPDHITVGGVDYPVDTIAYGAFSSDWNPEATLSSVVIPNSVTYIGVAFFNMPLTSVHIGSGVSNIENGAFDFCEHITSIVVDLANTTYDSRDNCNALIKTSTNEIIRGCNTTTLPSTVTSIGDNAFSHCSVNFSTIPENIMFIRRGAFLNCTFSSSTLYLECGGDIMEEAFHYANGFSSVVISENVLGIDGSAFAGCDDLASITVAQGNPNYDSRNNCNAVIHTTDDILILGCKNTVIPEEVTEIGYSAFRQHHTLTSIVIPNNVTTIHAEAFYYDGGLQSITFGSGLSEIEGYSFVNCEALESITLLSETPPTLNDNVFHTGNPSEYDFRPNCTLFVPCGKVSAYQNAAGWSDFENIQEMDGCTHTVTATSADEAMGSVTGGGSYPHGGEATLTATPNVGYHFVQWNDGNHDNPRSLTVTHDTTLTASFAPTTVYTTVDTSVCNNKFPFIWNGLTVTAAGSETVTLQNHLGADSIVTINVHLNYTSAGDTTAVEFDHFTWYGHTYHQSTSTPTHLLTNAAGCDSTVTLHLTINPSHLGEFEITATADDAAKGTVSGGGRFDAGQEVTLAASANCGYQFLQWSDGNTDNPRTVTVAGNATYTAQFQQANYIFETPSGQMLNYAVDCNTQTACVTGYTGLCRGLLVIPPLIRIEGVIYVVVSIGPSAFENNTGLLRVMIPGTVDAIYESAFRGCTNLAKVEGWYQLKGLE